VHLIDGVTTLLPPDRPDDPLGAGADPAAAGPRGRPGQIPQSGPGPLPQSGPGPRSQSRPGPLPQSGSGSRTGPAGEVPQPTPSGRPGMSPPAPPGRPATAQPTPPGRPGIPQPADGFPAGVLPQRQVVPPPPTRFAAIPGAWAPPVPPETQDARPRTVIAPPVHPPNLPSTPMSAGGPQRHVPVPAGPRTAPATMRDLRILLAGDPRVRREQVGQALSWLLENLDQPQVVAATCAGLGPALQHLGASPQRLDAMGVLVADALRAQVGGTWRQEHYDAWRSSTRLVASWMGQGMERIDYEPAFWTATVVGYERQGDAGALLNVRTYLPYRFTPGQVATVESARHPQLWHPYAIAGPPGNDNTVMIEVRVAPDDLVADALVNATAVGDRVRLRPALGRASSDE